jgi:hypothetical protein
MHAEDDKKEIETNFSACQCGRKSMFMWRWCELSTMKKYYANTKVHPFFSPLQLHKFSIQIKCIHTKNNFLVILKHFDISTLKEFPHEKIGNEEISSLMQF